MAEKEEQNMRGEEAMELEPDIACIWRLDRKDGMKGERGMEL